jgi:hypothetical protein
MKTPALYDLMGGYFHQDWWTYGTEDDVVDQFMTDQLTLRDRLVPEIHEVLAADFGEDELDALVKDLGAQYNPARKYGSTREWLESIVHRAAAYRTD